MLDYLCLIKFTDSPHEGVLRERRSYLMNLLGAVLEPDALRMAVPADRASEEAWDIRISIGPLKSTTGETWRRLDEALERGLSATPCVRKGWFFRSSPVGES